MAEPLNPTEYFERYISKGDFENMAYFTNIYAVQQNMTFKITSASERQILFGLHIVIACLHQFLRVRTYWKIMLGFQAFLEN